MSVICAEGDQVGACENDIAINFLKELFGTDFIEAFYIAGTDHPAIVNGGDTILSLIASNLAGAALITTFIILIFNIWKGIGSSANDGGAVAFSSKSSLLGIYGRPLFSLVMLTPTISGFPVVYILIVLITLTANGLTNEGFDAYVTNDYNPQTMVARLDSPHYLAANDLMRPAFYGALHGYCVKLAEKEFQAVMKMTRSDTFLNPQTLSKINAIPALTASPQHNHNYSIQYEDSSGFEVLGFSFGRSGIVGDACGSFSAKVPVRPVYLPTRPLAGIPPSNSNVPVGPANMPELANVSNHLINDVREVGAKISKFRSQAAQLAYFDAFAMANGNLPLLADGQDYEESAQYFCDRSVADGFNDCWGLSTLGWETDIDILSDPNTPNVYKPNIEDVIAIATARARELDIKISEQVLRGSGYTVYTPTNGMQGPTSNGAGFDTLIEKIKDQTLSQGWMAAGTYRTRLQKFRTSLQGALYTKPYTVTFSNVQDDGDTEELTKFLTHMNTVRSVMFEQASDSSDFSPYSDLKVESSIASINIKNRDAGGMMDKLAYSVTQSLFEAEKEMIETITGTGANDGVDSLTRIQGVGESIAGISLMLTAIHKVASIGIAALQMTAGSIGAGTADFVYDTSNAIDAVRNLYLDTLGGWLIDAIDALFDISRIFAVVIPTMPYVFLALAAVGWIMQIIQTCFGMPLFFIMHSIPDKSFVGSQAQGYVTLVSLGFRPIIILAAFFLSHALYDPVLTYVSQAYFSLHGEIAGASTDSSLARLLIVLSTFKYYWFVYGGIVMLVTYLVFGLVQELGDSVLNWLGTNLLHGFGNMETDGVMKGASGGMAAFAMKSKENKRQLASLRGSQIPSQNNPNSPQQPQQLGGGGGGGRSGGGGGANQPASLANGSRRSMGSSGPSPSTGHENMGANQRQSAPDTYAQRSGQLGASALVTAGSAATGGFRGARDIGKASFTKGKILAGGGFKGNIAGAGAAVGGAAVGGVRGAFGGAARGSRSILGRNAYQNNLQKANSRGDIGTASYSSVKNNTAKLNANASIATVGGAPLTPKGFARKTGLSSSINHGTSTSFRNNVFKPIAPKVNSAAGANKLSRSAARKARRNTPVI